MKTLIISITVLFCLGLGVNAQDMSSFGDSTVTALRVKQLEQSREQLKAKIASEDRKRNVKDDSAVPEALEMMNMKQDSVCLALRSDLLAVELELKELTPESSVEAVTAIFNSMKKEQEPAKEDEGGIRLSGQK